MQKQIEKIFVDLIQKSLELPNDYGKDEKGNMINIENLEDCLPCGYCRQFMSEFTDENFKVYALGPNDKITPYTMNDLLPNNFISSS